MDKDLGVEEDLKLEGEEGLVYKMPLSAKGRRTLNVLLREYGKRKGRDIFYSIEHQRPDWVKKWRK